MGKLHVSHSVAERELLELAQMKSREIGSNYCNSLRRGARALSYTEMCRMNHRILHIICYSCIVNTELNHSRHFSDITYLKYQQPIERRGSEEPNNKLLIFTRYSINNENTYIVLYFNKYYEVKASVIESLK